MKRITGIKHLLLMLVVLVCAGNAWAEEKTITYIQNETEYLPSKTENVTYSLGDISFSYLCDPSLSVSAGKVKISGVNYTHYVKYSANPSFVDGVPSGGAVMGFVPKYNGTLEVAIIVNSGKSIYIYEDGSFINGVTSSGDVISEGTKLSTKLTGSIKFDVQAGKQYYLYCTGSKMSYYGFVYNYNTSVVANYDVTTSVSPADVASVVVSKTGVDETTMEVKATASAIDGYALLEWQDKDGNRLSTANPYSFTITADTEIKAIFSLVDISPTANAEKNVAIAGTSYTIDGTYNPSGTGSNYGSMLKQASVKLRTNQAGNTLTFGVNEGWKITGITLAGYANDKGTISVTSASVDGVAVENFATVTFPANTENKSATVKLENISALESVTLNFDNSAVVNNSQIYATYIVYYTKSGIYDVDVTCSPEVGGSVHRAQDTNSDGVTDEITLTATANKHYTFKEWQDAEGNVLSSVNPYSFETTADKSIVAVFEEDVKYSVIFSKDESVEGQVPDAVSNYVGETVTIPSNFWLYKEGYTLTGWTDEEATYTAGQKITIGEQDVILTPVFRANTVSLTERTADVTVRWIFGREEGAPIVAWEGSKYPDMTWVAQAKVGGETIDVKLGVDASSGKMNNASRTDKLCQVNGGTKYYVPVCDGAIISMEASDVIAATTIAGEAIGGESKTPSYTYKGSDEEVEIVINDGRYYRYIQVVLPANILLVEDDKDLTATGTFESATYSRTVNTAYNYGTICLPFAPDAETCAKYTFYALDSYGANALVFTKVDAPAANTAYLYCAADKQTTTHTFTGGETTVSNEIAEPVGDYKFIGVLAKKVFTLAETDGTFYVYKPTEENGYKDVFGKAVGTTMTVKPYRAYIHAAAAAQSLATMRIVVRGQGDNGDGTTAIEEVITPDQIEGAVPATIYNLMGQPVALPVKGQIYIVNGQKVVY